MNRQRLILSLWILGTLLPMAWFRRFSATYSRLFYRLFHPDWVHVLMHVFLFTVLAYLLARPLARRLSIASGWRFGIIVLGLVLTVALLQEGIQAAFRGYWPGADELFDVGIDALGGGLGLLAYRVQVRWVGRSAG